jgi:uncharacterized protein YndB with AHSA1/START domain
MTTAHGDYVAQASTTIDAPSKEVWQALVDPEMISQYMFGTKVNSDWKVGTEITWSGDWKGEPYQDKGTILGIEPERSLRYSHFSPLSGKPDIPDNYHTVTIELSRGGPATTVTLTQDNNDTPEAKTHSEQNWQSMLDELKNLVEASSSDSAQPPSRF